MHKSVAILMGLTLLIACGCSKDAAINSDRENNVATKKAEKLSTSPNEPAIAEKTKKDVQFEVRFFVHRDRTTEVHAINADGSEPKRLRVLPEVVGVQSPIVFSPDGSKVAFEMVEDGNRDIYIIGIDGSNLHRLTQHRKSDNGPRWSPDGKKIAWQSESTGVKQIWVMNSDGTEKQQLTDGSWNYGGCCWSPDGTKLGFTSHRDGNFEVYLMDADGTNQFRLTRSPHRDWGVNDWSPDGKRIMFVTRRNGEKAYDIFTSDTDGKNLRQLTEHPARDSEGRWSPNGKYIAFYSSRDGETRIYRMSSDGSDLIDLTKDRFPSGSLNKYDRIYWAVPGDPAPARP